MLQVLRIVLRKFEVSALKWHRSCLVSPLLLNSSNGWIATFVG